MHPRLENASYLTMAEAAHILRISKMTAYRCVNDGIWPALRIEDRIIRIPEQFVLDLVTSADEAAAEATLRRLTATYPEMARKVIQEHTAEEASGP